MPSRWCQAILFDIDGTLLDDDRAVSLALTFFHAAHGRELKLSLEALSRRWAELLDFHFARYLAGDVSLHEQRRARIGELFAESRPGLGAEDADGLFAAYESHYRAAWSAYPDALPAVAALDGFVLAALSNGDQAQQTDKLRACGLAGSFSWIYSSRETGFAKPDPEAFRGACRRLGIPPAHCVYVGDRLETDARASAAAGLTGVWLDRAGSCTSGGPGIRVIHTLAELPPLVCDG